MMKKCNIARRATATPVAPSTVLLALSDLSRREREVAKKNILARQPQKNHTQYAIRSGLEIAIEIEIGIRDREKR